MADALFNHIEHLQGDRPWGRVLDAGTGAHSLAWISGLRTEGWTAITADSGMLRRLQEDTPPRPGMDRLILGDWTQPELLRGERFDTVLADYLLGAIDGFAPYFQDQLFERLRPHVGARLYVVGWEPLLERDTAEARYLQDLYRFRDACMLIADVRPYREYPMEWTVRTLKRSGFIIEDARAFPIVHGEKSIERQFNNAIWQLPRIKDRALANALEAHALALKQRGQEFLKNGPIHVGSDYVVAARLV